MKAFSFFLFFSFFLLTFASSGESFDYQAFLDQMTKEQDEAKEFFNENSGNLSSIMYAMNKAALQQAEVLKKKIGKDLEKMHSEQEKIELDKKSMEEQQSKQIEELLNQNPHVLFDESESDESSDTDSYSADEENEILLAQFCTKAFVELIPPEFCVKKPIELGSTSDIVCGEGDERIGLLCYRNCASGYSNSGIMCNENCKSGYSVKGLLCYRAWYSWYFRGFYLRPFYTFYDTRATCRAPKIKRFIIAPLCFKNCERINLVNCGPHTCGMTHQKCSEGIRDIIKDLITGVGKLFLNVVTFGLSGLLTSLLTNKNALYNAAQQAGQQAMQDSYQNVKTWLGRINQNELINMMVDKTNQYISSNSSLTGVYTQERVNNRCSSVRDIFYEKIVNTDTVNLEWKDFKSKDLRDYVNMCKQANAGDTCKKAIRESALKWDPTGIVSMVAAFKQEDCPEIN